jgi:ABC-type multidrug transport system ATPase subunit
VRLDGVSKRYGLRQPWVVRDVSLEIRPGALVRFEGRNGTGKSTLLRMIAGVCVPSRGTVTGRPITGYVPERFPPALPFTARDYLAHIGRIQGLGGDTLGARIDASLDRLGGLEFSGVPLAAMSKGMCQKVAVAQALLPSSGLLVLDEAWTGLDVEAKAALDEAVAERIGGGGSVVFVDHDPRRLAHLPFERWQITHGEAARAMNTGPAERPAPAAATAGTAVIEVSGCPRYLAELLPGLIAVTWAGERASITVAAQDSDRALRELLGAGDQVHVSLVAAEPAAHHDEGEPQ